MPFVFIHGVAVRDQSALPGIEKLLRYYVAPVFSSKPDEVAVFGGFWGDLGATFAWDEASLPRDPTAKSASQGLARPVLSPVAAAKTLASYGDELFATHGRLLGPVPSSNARMGPGGSAPLTLSVDDASDLFTGALAANLTDGTPTHKNIALAASSTDYASVAIALDEVIRATGEGGVVTLDDATIANIEFRTRLRLTSSKEDSVASQGADVAAQGVVEDTVQRIGDVVQSVQDAIGDMTVKALIGIRQPLNHFVTLFTGDVFAYLQKRDDMTAPRSIIRRVTRALESATASKNGEPIVVLSHSMGGQLIYDTVTHYLDQLNLDVRIDFWATAASQVGLFEEMKLFKISSPDYSKANGNKAPSPVGKRLGYWWNVFDSSDWLSYSAAPIFNGVNEARFSSDASPLQAHGAYLVMPRFYRMFAAELQKALTA